MILDCGIYVIKSPSGKMYVGSTVFATLTEAQKWLREDLQKTKSYEVGDICSVCTGKKVSYLGYHWKYC